MTSAAGDRTATVTTRRPTARPGRIRSHKPGQPVDIRVVRGGSASTVGDDDDPLVTARAVTRSDRVVAANPVASS